VNNGYPPLSENLCHGSGRLDYCRAFVPLYQWEYTGGYIFSANEIEFDSLVNFSINFAGVMTYLYPTSMQDSRLIQIFRAIDSRKIAQNIRDKYVYGTQSSFSDTSRYSALTALGKCFLKATKGFSKPVVLPISDGLSQVICYTDDDDVLN
jgi:hypothetical protein